MKCVILVVSILFVLYVYSDAACWGATGNGRDCEYNGSIIALNTTYENTTGPKCYTCSCLSTGDLDCCDIGTVIIELPDTCKIIQEGCDQVAVSEVDESQPCEGPISAVEG